MFKCHPLLEALPDHFATNCNPSHPTSYTPESESANRSFVSNTLQHRGLYTSWNSPGQNTGVGSLSLLQGIFLTREYNRGLLHCRQILYQLSHQRSPGAWSNWLKCWSVTAVAVSSALSFASDPGGPCLLPTSIKLLQANLLVCKKVLHSLFIFKKIFIGV